MSGLFATFNILKKGISVQQGAINTTSHNISNADTEGYSRQKVTLEASRPISLYTISGSQQLGTGVDIVDISRIRDEFLDAQIRDETSRSEQYKARDEFMSEIETISLEPSYDDGPGLSVLIGKMWDAWQQLANDPESAYSKTNVVEATKTVTDTMNHIYDQLNDLKSRSEDLARQKVLDFNNYVSQIEDLNNQIASVAITGQNPNDLLDKQDLLIDKLSEMMNIEVQRDSYKRATITTNGGTVTIVGVGKLKLSFVENVDSSGVTYSNNGDLNDIKTSTSVNSNDYKDVKLVWTDGTDIISKAEPKSGSIMGYVSVIEDINTYQDELNALAKGIAYAINTVHNDGLIPPQVQYVPVFIANPEDVADAEGTLENENVITAGNITVSSDLADKLMPWTTDSTNVGDGSRALAIARLRDTRIDFSQFLKSGSSTRESNDLNYSNYSISDNDTGSTMEGYYRSIVVKVGSSAQQAVNMVENQKELLNQLKVRKDSISGVSIDEETVNLIQYQHSLNAAFKAVSVIDELLNSVINLIK